MSIINIVIKLIVNFCLYTKYMVDGDLGLTGLLVPLVVAVGNKRGRETAIIQNLSAVVQIVLLMDHPVRKLRIAMKIVAQVSKR